MLILLGIFFRFFNLDRYPYWGDEFFSLLRLSGYTQRELIDNVFTGTLMQIWDLNVYQSVHNGRTWLDTVQSLAIEDAQHPPLYYVLLRFWSERFGDSIAAIRSFSSLLSLLALPTIYWLSLELFALPLAAWFAVALVCVSPLHVLNAQEVREYGLWTVTILLSSLLLLRAMRRPQRQTWIAYAFSCTIGLYTFPMTVFVMVSHALYLGKMEAFQPSKTVKAFLIAIGGAAIAFLPWAIVIWQSRQQIIATNLWSSYPMTLIERWGNYGFNLALSFVAIPHAFSKLPQAEIAIELWLTIPPVVLATIWISAYALYFLMLKAPPAARWFLLSLMGVTFVALFLPDVLTGSRRSTAYRYLMPCYLGLHLAIADLMAVKLSATNRRSHLWRGLIFGLLLSAVVTGMVHTQVEGGLNYYREPEHPQIAQIIHAAPHPLLIGSINRSLNRLPGADGSLGVLFTLLHRLEPSTWVQLVVEPQVPILPEGYQYFLYNPSEYLLNSLRQQYDASRLQASLQGELWQLKPR
ncbi:glycosyltransferase family 39 protein [Leptolyngbya sp. AN03gr2]